MLAIVTSQSGQYENTIDKQQHHWNTINRLIVGNECEKTYRQLRHLFIRNLVNRLLNDNHHQVHVVGNECNKTKNDVLNSNCEMERLQSTFPSGLVSEIQRLRTYCDDFTGFIVGGHDVKLVLLFFFRVGVGKFSVKRHTISLS